MHSNTGWFGETHVSAIAGYVWRDVSLGIRLSHPTQIPHCRLLAPTSRGIEHLSQPHPKYYVQYTNLKIRNSTFLLFRRHASSSFPRRPRFLNC